MQSALCGKNGSFMDCFSEELKLMVVSGSATGYTIATSQFVKSLPS